MEYTYEDLKGVLHKGDHVGIGYRARNDVFERVGYVKDLNYRNSTLELVSANEGCRTLIKRTGIRGIDDKVAPILINDMISMRIPYSLGEVVDIDRLEEGDEIILEFREDLCCGNEDNPPRVAGYLNKLSNYSVEITSVKPDEEELGLWQKMWREFRSKDRRSLLPLEFVKIKRPIDYLQIVPVGKGRWPNVKVVGSDWK